MVRNAARSPDQATRASTSARASPVGLRRATADKGEGVCAADARPLHSAIAVARSPGGSVSSTSDASGMHRPHHLRTVPKNHRPRPRNTVRTVGRRPAADASWV